MQLKGKSTTNSTELYHFYKNVTLKDPNFFNEIGHTCSNNRSCIYFGRWRIGNLNELIVLIAMRVIVDFM